MVEIFLTKPVYVVCFWTRWRRYCCSICFYNSSFFGVGCIILISNIILGEHMNVKMVFMLISKCWWYTWIYVNGLEDSTFFRRDKHCEFMYCDSTWFSITRWHTIWFWTLATKIFVFFFYIKLDFLLCWKKIVKNFQPGSFVLLKCEESKMKLNIWFDSFKVAEHLVSV